VTNTYKGVDPVKPPEAPKELSAVADVVLAYRPKLKSKPAKNRKRRTAKAQKPK
jgi:hypothetical protein